LARGRDAHDRCLGPPDEREWDDEPASTEGPIAGVFIARYAVSVEESIEMYMHLAIPLRG